MEVIRGAQIRKTSIRAVRLPGAWLACLLSVALATPAWSQTATNPATQVPPGPTSGVLEPTPPPTGLLRWLDPATAPFLPVPLIGVDPDSGTTLGLLPVRLQTDENNDIRRIIAPDVLHNPYFGFGTDARVYDYPSEDTQWSIVGGIKQRVERGIDAEYQGGRLREQMLSINASLLYERSGVSRFYGIGNQTLLADQTNYTTQQELAQIQVGLNLSHAWQVQYTGRIQVVDVLPGTLTGIPTLQSRFGDVIGIGTTAQLLNRIAIGYDTRDNVTAPSRGVEWQVYTGRANRLSLFHEAMYTEAGFDGRDFWPISADSVLATHVSLRYLPSTHDVPFWALSNIGGEQAQIGGQQPLRGYGIGRYYDRDSFSATAELRHRLMTINAVSSHIELELAPFIDVGRVFSDPSTFPISHLHPVGGLGIRGIARPFVVGYVDIGYGHEGVAVFTGINYPF